MSQRLVDYFCYIQNSIIFQIRAKVYFCKEKFLTPLRYIASNYSKLNFKYTKLEAGNSSINNHTLDRSDVLLMQIEADSLFSMKKTRIRVTTIQNKVS